MNGINRILKNQRYRPIRLIIRPGGRLVGVWLALLLLAGGGLAYAQSGGSYDLTWWTIDGGGAVAVSGGPYTLLSGVGQPDAAPNAGGGYTLQSGFWPSYLPAGDIYLPIIMNGAPAPDLVGAFTLGPAGPNFNAGQPVAINVTVTNQGAGSAGPFWVDFYINPSATPTVNSRWNDLCSLNPCYGLAWYVSGLGAGQTINLSSGNYAANYSFWPGSFAGGTTNLHLYVDTWNPGVSGGGVNESNEGNNLYTYPGGVVVTGLGAGGVETLSPADLPPRPVRLVPNP